MRRWTWGIVGVSAFTILVCPTLRTGAVAAPVSQSEARKCADRFVGETRAGKLRPMGLVNGSRGWIEGKCYSFTLPLGLWKLRPKWPLYDGKATMLVQEQTGRVVQYRVVDAWYREVTGYKKPVPVSKLIGKGKAVARSLKLLGTAGVSTDDLRPDPVRLMVHEQAQQRNWYVYYVYLRKYVKVPDIGEVEMPTMAHVEMNAVTGELLTYDLLDQPVRVQPVPPPITRARAEQIVRDTNPSGRNPYGEWGKADCQLCIGSPAQVDSPQRYFWRVTVQYNPARPRDTAATACVDAMTGELIEMAVPICK